MYSVPIKRGNRWQLPEWFWTHVVRREREESAGTWGVVAGMWDHGSEPRDNRGSEPRDSSDENKCRAVQRSAERRPELKCLLGQSQCLRQARGKAAPSTWKGPIPPRLLHLPATAPSNQKKSKYRLGCCLMPEPAPATLVPPQGSEVRSRSVRRASSSSLFLFFSVFLLFPMLPSLWGAFNITSVPEQLAKSRYPGRPREALV